MSGADWHIKGDYFETCSCDYLCPCIFTNMSAMPTDGVCEVAIVLDIAEGHYGDTRLDGVAFVTAAMVAGPMGDGNWTLGLIIDERASEAQVEAVGRICSGDEGGPMALMAPLVGTFAGVERAAIKIERREMGFSITAGDLLSHGAEGVPELLIPPNIVRQHAIPQQGGAPRIGPQPLNASHRLERCGGATTAHTRPSTAALGRAPRTWRRGI